MDTGSSATSFTAAPSRRSATKLPSPSSSSARRKNKLFPERRIRRALDEVQQITFAVREEQNFAAARRRSGFFSELHTALFQFRLRRVERIHAQREVAEAGELVVTRCFQ